MEERETAGRTTLKQRFGGFATAHICYSLLGVSLFSALFLMQMGEADLSRFSIALQGILSMAVYFFLGVLAAGWGEWSVPTTREKVWAVVQPCFISVSWAALALLAMRHVSVDEDAFLLILPSVFLVSILLAAPSSFFFLIWAGLGLNPIVSALLAAVLPPLLFGLGSFWQAKRQKAEKHHAEIDEAGV